MNFILQLATQCLLRCKLQEKLLCLTWPLGLLASQLRVGWGGGVGKERQCEYLMKWLYEYPRPRRIPTVSFQINQQRKIRKEVSFF